MSLRWERLVSPEGNLLVELMISEWRQLMWIHSPRLTDVATGRILLDLWGTNWHAQTSWVGDTGVCLTLQRHDRVGSVTVTIDPANNLYRVIETVKNLGEIDNGARSTIEPPDHAQLDHFQPQHYGENGGTVTPLWPGNDEQIFEYAALDIGARLRSALTKPLENRG